MPENDTNFFQKNAELFVFTGLAAICAGVFARAVGFDFINFDDNFYVYDNPFVLGGWNWESVKWAFTTYHSANWHPLTWLSHMTDAQFFGRNPGAHHATNILFHIVNSFLAFVVFRKMTGSFWKSAVVAALFAVHPAHVESVAWISERKDVLSTMFWLLTMWAYLRYASSDAETGGRGDTEKIGASSSRRVSVSFYLVVALFALGLMSKPMLVTLPFVLLLCDYWALERLKKLKDLAPLVIEKLPLFILSAVSAYLTVSAQRSYGAVQTLAALPLDVRLTNALVAAAKYIVMLFYPTNLGVYYLYSESIPAWQIAGSILLLGGITAICIWQRERRKYLIMGWLWFLGTMVPVIGIVQVGAQSMADRYTYVPYFGLFVMVVWGGWDLLKLVGTDRKIMIAAAGIVSAILLTLGFLAYKQTSYWKNAITLYSHTLDAGHGNFVVKLNFCNALLRENRLEEAEQRCNDAIAENPNYADSHLTRGVVLYSAGRTEEAIASFKKTIELRPTDTDALTNIAAPLLKLGETDEAAQNLGRAAEIYKARGVSPAVLAQPYNMLGAGYAGQKRFDKAAETLGRALQFAPERADIRANYALMLYFQDKLDEARREIERAISQNPNQPQTYNTFGLILARQSDAKGAAAQFEKALELMPDYAEAKQNLEKVRGEKKN